MQFQTNENKKVEIKVNGKIYMRHAIHTHFVHPRRKLSGYLSKICTSYL